MRYFIIYWVCQSEGVCVHSVFGMVSQKYPNRDKAMELAVDGIEDELDVTYAEITSIQEITAEDYSEFFN